MLITLNQRVDEPDPNDEPYVVADSLIEKIWCDLDKQLPRERIYSVVAKVALRYRDARVKAFLPIFIYRRSLEKLKQELNEFGSTDDLLPDETK